MDDYVEGPSSSTDNAIARYNGTTGKIIQNSNATIDDSGNTKIKGDFYVPAQKYIKMGDGTTNLATFRANANGAFIIGACDGIYFRGGLGSADSAQAVGIVQNKTGFIPEINNTIDLGSSSKQWNNIYGKTIYENGTSLANKYLLKSDYVNT